MSDIVESEIKGTYVAVKYNPYSLTKLIEVAHEYNVPNVISLDDMHTTLIYSTKGADTVEVHDKINYIGIPNKFNIWESQNGSKCLVLILNCNALVERNTELMNKYDFVSDYPEYTPHITLSYDVGNWGNLEKLNEKIIKNKIYYMVVTTHEYVEDLNIGWKDDK